MHTKTPKHTVQRRKTKISVLFILLMVAFSIFVFKVLSITSNERKIPSHNHTIHDRSFRGDIISSDNYTLSHSEKSYTASVRGASIKPEMQSTFVTLFSIYSGMSKKEVSSKFFKKGKKTQGYLILTKDVTSSKAVQLKDLALKLRRLGTFQSIKTSSGVYRLFGLDIIENGESRIYPLTDVLTPVLGYTRNILKDGYSRPEGQQGLERYYETHITSKYDGYFEGKRDVLRRIIHDKNSINSQRVDGLDLHLNISLDIQRRVELMIDAKKADIDADEIIVGIMDSKTGKVLSMASTERYNPASIKQKEVSFLQPKFTEYPYEAGSVLKPITLAIALDKEVVTPDTWFDTGYKKFDITGGQSVSDDDYFDDMQVDDIIVHSSNIGISQISWRLTGEEFREGLLKFGVAKPSGIDLVRDLPGVLKPLYKLKHKMHRANSSFGYGMMVTFSQLFKAYSAFNNDGLAVTPRLVDYLGDKDKHYKLPPKMPNTQAISKRSSNQIHDILLQVVNEGTGKAAQYPGLGIGGKTGTAHIAKNGRYVNEYHSSFYGFANDKYGNKYTIGALVIRAKKYRHYFASKSAVPVFRNMVQILVEKEKLIPEIIEEADNVKQVSMYGSEEKSIKSLFEMKKEVKAVEKKIKVVKRAPSPVVVELKPKPKPKPKPRPMIQAEPYVPKKSAHELFDDLY
jgi:cell division protein FtsI (penicillin-binding protein 3)